MKIGIMQPYFMPYIGYFQLMKAVDKYIVYDDVNYIKGGWVSRNNIIVNKEKKLFTITLKGASPNKLFNEIEINDDFKKLERTLQLNYTKSPFFKETMILLERIFSFPEKQLALFIANSFKEVLSYLNIDTKIILSSSLNKDCTLKGQEKVLNICGLLNADAYYNAIGGQSLYSKEEFKDNGIDLFFIDTHIQSYSQHSNEFISHLSIIDVLMNNSIEKTNNMLDNYSLI